MRAPKLFLLVEDNEDDEVMTVDAIRRSGANATIEVVRDGEEALDWLFGRGEHAGRDASVQPDAILLDIRMPKRSGLEVLKAVRSDARTAHLPVVMLTSSGEWQDLARAYELGANSYIEKPIGHKDFTRVVGLVGLYWSDLNKTPGVPLHQQV